MSAAAIGRFGFVLHPLYVSQFANKFPIARYLPGRFVEAVFRAVPPFEASQITGIVSPTGARAEGWFIALPWTPRVLLATPPERWHELSTILDACDKAAREAQTHVAIPKRFTLGVREMFALQPRLEHPRGRRALRGLEHPRFRAAYDLLLLRAEHGLASPEMARWWTRIQEVSGEERANMADALTGEAQRLDSPRRGGRRRRRRHRPPAPS